MASARPHVDQRRLWDDVMALAEITDPDLPYTRRSFSPRFLDGRDWLRRRFHEAGLVVRLDCAANLIGRLDGSEGGAPAIMLGSHSDTVPSGGRFDGIAGVIAALEVVRAIRNADYRPRHPIEIVDFLAEEPSEYGVSCVGSRAMAGALEEAALARTDGQGETLAAGIRRVGGDPDRIAEARRSGAAAYLELHIEQGAALQSRGIDLGIVTSIVGITRIEIVLRGAADHAGTTPQDRRRDAALAAAELMLFVDARARELAGSGRGHFVATTGVLEVRPNAANVVPGEARMVLDIRAEDPALIAAFTAALDAESQAVASRTGVDRCRFALLSSAPPTPCDATLREVLTRAAAVAGHSTMQLASGAGHDAAFVARFAPSAMLFVPCRDGKSHAPEEWAEPEALAAGAATLYQAVRILDDRP